MRGLHIICTAAALLTLGCTSPDAPKQVAAPATAPTPATRAADAGQSLFDGKTLGHWKPTIFGGEGEVKVEDGTLVLKQGNSLTGVTWQGPVPEKINYEIDLDAKRVDGNDFFCGLTFPMNDTSASLILGGWGGAVCGISSLDDEDAARNETMTQQSFKTNKWYHIRMRVTQDNLSAWVDNLQIVDVDTKGKKISVRAEVDPSRPLGLCSFETTAAFKNIRMRKVSQ